MIGDNCTSSCKTRDHNSWGECMQSKSIQFGNKTGSHRKWQNELDLYAKARSQGIQPDGTTTQAVRQALDVSDKAGAAYGTDFAQATPMGD
jgi:hypothetical protein